MLTTTRMTLISLRVLVYLYEKGERVGAKELAAHNNFSDRAITLNMSRLVKAGILSSGIGGTSRGYKFTRDPKNIYMSEILEVLEGGMKFLCCTEILDNMSCKFDCEKCVIYHIMNDGFDKIMNNMKKLSVYTFAHGM